MFCIGFFFFFVHSVAETHLKLCKHKLWSTGLWWTRRSWQVVHSWSEESWERLLLAWFSQGVWTPTAIATGHVVHEKYWGSSARKFGVVAVRHTRKRVGFQHRHVRLIYYKINRKLVWFSLIHLYTIPQLPLWTWQKLSTSSLTIKRVAIANPTAFQATWAVCLIEI